MRTFPPETLLRWTGSQAEAGATARRLDVFSWLLLVHLLARELVRCIETGGDPLRMAWAAGFGLALALSLVPALRGWAIRVALAVAVSKAVWVFPGSSNHFFLELMCLSSLSLRSARGDEGAETREILAALRWIPALVFFWSGLNKALYGTYFNGAFLASWMPNRSFAWVFGWLMPDAELQAILRTEPPGPFAFESSLALVASNAVWVGEIAAGLLLLYRPLRPVGLLVGLALLIGIEIGARELLFGLLMLNLLALYQPLRWTEWMLPASAVAYATLITVRAWIAPDWAFN